MTEALYLFISLIPGCSEDRGGWPRGQDRAEDVPGLKDPDFMLEQMEQVAEN